MVNRACPSTGGTGWKRQTHERALAFEAQGSGWAYGDTPIVVLTHRSLPTRSGVEFYSGDLAHLLGSRLRPRHRSTWCVGSGEVAAACLRLALADEIRFSVLPVVIGDGISFFQGLDRTSPCTWSTSRHTGVASSRCATA